MATGMTGNALYKCMRQVVHSADGIKRAVRATNDGQPALAGVDELLRRELGAEYARANDGAWWAGFTVAEVMREMGTRKPGRASVRPVAWPAKASSGGQNAHRR